MTRHERDLPPESDLRAEGESLEERTHAGDRDVATADDGPGRPLLVDDSDELLERWQRLQAEFVDSPRDAVNEAGDIVRDVLDRLSRSFDDERRRLDEVWESGGEPTTEDLRVALRRYRTFFERLLSA